MYAAAWRHIVRSTYYSQIWLMRCLTNSAMLDLDLSLHTTLNKFKKRRLPSRRLLTWPIQSLKIRISVHLHYQAQNRWRGRTQTMGLMRTMWVFFLPLLLPLRAILMINRRNLDTLMLVSMDNWFTIFELTVDAEPCNYISQQTKQDSLVWIWQSSR